MTKKIFLFTLLICLLPLSFMAQVWGNGALGINFQAVVRDDAGQPISGMLVDVQVKIKDQSTNATLYSEQFLDVATDGYGLMNFVIGDGSPMIGFTNAEFDYDWWFSNPVYVEVSYSGGGPYTVLGTYPLEAVPYAFSSRVAEMAKTPLFGLDELYEMSTEDATDGQIIVRVGTTWDNKDPQWKPGSTAGTIVNHQSANTRVGITNAAGESVTSAGILSINKEIAAGNSIDDVVTLTRMTSGSVNNGLGAGLGFYTEVSGGNVAEVAQVSGVLEDAATQKGALQFSTRTGGSLGAKMRLEADGDLGIGTTIPQQALHVHRSGSTEARIKLTNSTTGDLSPDGFEITQGGLHTYLTNLEAGSLYLGTDNNLGNFVIRPSGEMGFGTWNNNLAKFQFEGVNGNTSAAFRSNSTTSAGMSMIADWPGLGFNAYYNGGFKSMGNSGYMGHITCDQNAGGFIFGLGTTAVTGNGQAQTLNEKMRLTKDGYIGLGTANPIRPLHMHSESNSATGIQFTTAGSGSGAFNGGFLRYEYGYGMKFGTYQPTEDLLLYAGGTMVLSVQPDYKVGINFALPQGDLSIGQSDFVSSNGGFWLSDPSNVSDHWQHGYGTSDDYDWYWNGSLKAYVADVTGAWNQVSDRSMKKDIEYFNGGILQKVSLLKPATYRYKDNAADAQKAIGFIAQEVEEVFPSLVYEKDGLKTLNYGDFAVLSVAAIQELNAKVEAQSSEIDALRKQLEELTTTVNQLKN